MCLGADGDPVVLLCYRGSMNGLPDSFAWGNFSVLAVGVWAVGQRDSVDAVLMVSLLLFHVPPSKRSEFPGASELLLGGKCFERSLEFPLGVSCGSTEFTTLLSLHR